MIGNWVKVEAGHYVLHDSDGRVVATAVKTGVAGRDLYPWEWSVGGFGTELPYKRGSEDTLADCKDAAEAFLATVDHEPAPSTPR